MNEKSNEKNKDVRDLDAKKDAKGGGHHSQQEHGGTGGSTRPSGVPGGHSGNPSQQ